MYKFMKSLKSVSHNVSGDTIVAAATLLPGHLRYRLTYYYYSFWTRQNYYQYDDVTVHGTPSYTYGVCQFNNVKIVYGTTAGLTISTLCATGRARFQYCNEPYNRVSVCLYIYIHIYT